MMEAKDWLSFFVGAIIGALGLLPLLYKFLKIGPAFFELKFVPINIFAYIMAGIGFYLIINSFIEITNSNPVGWFSFLLAGLIVVTGVLKALGQLGVVSGFLALPFLNGISPVFYYIVFVIEGFFLMIAAFAMEM
ncbi:hypothetical protein KY345_05485 [Candidatus Woesearchaeota archaeon]|nr:hypothetical protein [Candidatus Woesearchaeota archaeon]